jgi:hypothetical protein
LWITQAEDIPSGIRWGHDWGNSGCYPKGNGGCYPRRNTGCYLRGNTWRYPQPKGT